MSAEPVRGLILDIDGVIIRNNDLIPGSREALKDLRDHKIPFVFTTNSSRLTPEAHVKRFARFGIYSTPDQFVTSAIVTAQRLIDLQQNTREQLRVYLIGETGLRAALKQRGIRIINSFWKDDHWVDDTFPTDIVVGYMKGFQLAKHGNPAVSAILDQRHPARFMATNDDALHRSQDGRLFPANGLVVAGISSVTGRRPEVIGKPHPPLFNESVRRLNLSPRQIVVVGDNMREDMFGTREYNQVHQLSAGIRSFAVLTGVLTTEDLKNCHWCVSWLMNHDVLRRERWRAIRILSAFSGFLNPRIVLSRALK